MTAPFPMEDVWAASHPERFGFAFKNDTIRIYKIIKWPFDYLNYKINIK
jgi:hypothetical protein